MTPRSESYSGSSAASVGMEKDMTATRTAMATASTAMDFEFIPSHLTQARTHTAAPLLGSLLKISWETI